MLSWLLIVWRLVACGAAGYRVPDMHHLRWTPRKAALVPKQSRFSNLTFGSPGESKFNLWVTRRRKVAQQSVRKGLQTSCQGILATIMGAKRRQKLPRWSPKWRPNGAKDTSWSKVDKQPFVYLAPGGHFCPKNEKRLGIPSPQDTKTQARRPNGSKKDAQRLSNSSSGSPGES